MGTREMTTAVCAVATFAVGILRSNLIPEQEAEEAFTTAGLAFGSKRGRADRLIVIISRFNLLFATLDVLLTSRLLFLCNGRRLAVFLFHFRLCRFGSGLDRRLNFSSCGRSGGRRVGSYRSRCGRVDCLRLRGRKLESYDFFDPGRGSGNDVKRGGPGWRLTSGFGSTGWSWGFGRDRHLYRLVTLGERGRRFFVYGLRAREDHRTGET